MKPFVSYLLFAYNQEAFIEEALRGALAQTYPEMEIIVTDDASTDGTAAIIERVLAAYTGDRTVRFIQNERNLGLASAFNAAVVSSRGDIIVGAAGDDVSCPDRSGTIASAFAGRDSVMAVYSNAKVIDAAGRVERVYYPRAPRSVVLDRFFEPEASIHGATAAYRRAVFEAFEPLPDRLYSEDRVLSLRSAILGEVCYLSAVLVGYRAHDSNVWHGTYDKSLTDFVKWRDRQRLEQEGQVGILACRLRDLEKALSFKGVDRMKLLALKAATTRFLIRARAASQMLARPGSLKKVALTMKVFAAGIDPQHAKKWISLHFFTARLFEKQRRRAITGERG